MRFALMFAAVVASACSGTTPTPPSSPFVPPSTPTPPAPTTATVTGRVTATNGGQALSGIAVTLGAQTVISDASGAFSSVLPLLSGNLPLTMIAPGILTRVSTAAVNASRTLPLDAIVLGGGFDQNFYRNFVRNTLDEPKDMEMLRRWTRNPSIYLRTVDDVGAALDAKTLDATESAIRQSLSLWTGGTLSIAAFERGTAPRALVGWITVNWHSDRGEKKCGSASVGANPGSLDLFYKGDNPNGTCRCPGLAETSPRVVSHELGHALGFWHTDHTNDVMYFQYQSNCDPLPSARERYHAAIAYRRPVGNVDPDADPTSSVLSLPFRVVY